MTTKIESYEKTANDARYWETGVEYAYRDLEAQWRAESYQGLELPDEVYGNRTLLMNAFSDNRFNWGAYMELPRFKQAILSGLKPSMLKVCLAWIEALKVGNSNLVFVGANNTGKTHSSMAACRFMMLHGILRRSDDLYMPNALMLECVDAHNILDGWAKDQDAARNVTKYKEVPLLLLDDLGAVAMSSSSALSNIAAIVTYRYNNNLPMVATSNLKSDELNGLYGSTIVRRVFSDGSKIHGV